MRPLRDLSVRFKITTALVAVVGVVLAISTFVALMEQRRSAKSALVAQMTALASVFADATTTALVFEDPTAASKVIASLKGEPNVVYAAVFDAQGQPFAIYPSDGPTSVSLPERQEADDPWLFRDRHLHVFRNIETDDAMLGQIYLRVSMQKLNDSLRRQMQIALGSLAVCLGIAVFLGVLVQRIISAPILQMSAAMEKVSQDVDYSVRVQKMSNDELGRLSDGFNAMLEQIQDRDRELDQHRNNLEQLVHERTRDLEAKTNQLSETNEQLSRSNQELDDFAYIVSHDLKEPLRGISNYASFIAEDYADRLDDAGREKINTLKRLCQRQEDLINSLLHYSRVGRAELAVRETDLDEVVKDIVEMMDVMLKESDVEVRIPRRLPKVHCDSVRIVEVFRNLITNAVKYNDKQEKWVEVGYHDNDIPGEDAGGAAANGAGVVFFIRDNGIGIRDKHQGSIFRIFKRLHGRDKFGGGTGAGLTFVKKIVERHGGRIWLESTYGEGTTFFFTVGKLRRSASGEAD